MLPSHHGASRSAPRHRSRLVPRSATSGLRSVANATQEMQCAENFRQPLQVVVIRGRVRRRLPPVLRGRVAGFSGRGRRLRQASNIRGAKKEENPCADHYPVANKDFPSTMTLERDLIGNHGHKYSNLGQCCLSNPSQREKFERKGTHYAKGEGA